MKLKVNRIPEEYNKNIHEHNLMQASIDNAYDVTEFIRAANESGRDAIVLSNPGCVIAHGDSKAMQETIAKFGAYRQDVTLADGQAVETYWPAPGENAQTLAQNMTNYYGERAAIEQCMQMGVDTIDTKNTVAVAMSGVSDKNAPAVTQILASEFDNAITVARDGGVFKAYTQLDDKVVEQLDNMGYAQRSSTGVDSPVKEFRFQNMQEVQQFLKDAEALSAQHIAQEQSAKEEAMEASVKIVPKGNITLIQAHELSMSDATDALSKIGDEHKNPVVLKSMDGSKNNLNIVVDGNSELGRRLAEKFDDNLTGSTSPSVKTFHFNSAQESVAFLKEANEIATTIEREQKYENSLLSESDFAESGELNQDDDGLLSNDDFEEH